MLDEFPRQVRAKDGQRYFIDTMPLAYLREIEPIDRAGYSIGIYSARQVRHAYASADGRVLWRGFGQAYSTAARPAAGRTNSVSENECE